MTWPIVFRIAKPGDPRGWMALGLFFEVNVIIAAMVINPHLADIDLFKSIAQAVVLQGFLQLAASFYFTASKNGVELANANAATVSALAASSPPISEPPVTSQEN